MFHPTARNQVNKLTPRLPEFRILLFATWFLSNAIGHGLQPTSSIRAARKNARRQP
jgi:hypothetical protein